MYSQLLRLWVVGRARSAWRVVCARFLIGYLRDDGPRWCLRDDGMSRRHVVVAARWLAPSPLESEVTAARRSRAEVALVVVRMVEERRSCGGRWPSGDGHKKTPLLLLLLSFFFFFFFWGGGGGGTATQPRNKAEPKSTRRALLPIGNGGFWRPYARVRLQKRIPPSLRVFDTNNPNNQNMRFSTQRPSARSTRTSRTTNNRRAGGSRTPRFCSACSCKNRMSFRALPTGHPNGP